MALSTQYRLGDRLQFVGDDGRFCEGELCGFFRISEQYAAQRNRGFDSPPLSPGFYVYLQVKIDLRCGTPLLDEGLEPRFEVRVLPHEKTFRPSSAIWLN